MVDVEPRRAQDTAAVLSEPHHKDAAGQRVVVCARMAVASTRAASSRSLFVRSPDGLSAVMRRRCIAVGKGVRNTIGGPSANLVGTQKPPMPCADASVEPTYWGARGINVVMGTGSVAREDASVIQS